MCKKFFNLIITLLVTFIFINQVEAKEIKPLFGLYKINCNDVDDYLKHSWEELYMSEEAAKIYPNLAAAISKYTNEEHKNAIKRQKQYRKDAKQLAKEAPEIKVPQFYSNNELIICRADSVVLSVLENIADYMGGVHGIYGYFGVNFDSETGTIIKISDICTNNEDLVKAIMTRLHEDSPNSPFEDAEEYITQQIADGSIKFTIEPKSISFHFNPYEIGSYAEGLFTATLLFSDFPDLFNQKYTQIPEQYCQSMPLYSTNIVSLKNGMRDFIQFETNDSVLYKISCGEGTVEDKTGLQGVKSLLLVHMADDQNYLYVDGFIENEGRRLHVYKISDDKIELVHNLQFSFKNIGTRKYETWWIVTDPNNIRFDTMEPVGNKNRTSHFGGITEDGSIAFG